MIFISYYYIYFYTTILSLFGLFHQNKFLKFFSLSLIVYILVLYAGLRIPSGGDWYNYILTFQEINNYSDIFNYSIYSKEPLYLLLNVFIKSISDNYFILFLFIAFFSIILNFLSYKKYTKYYFVSIILYVSFFYYFRELGAIRAGLAYSIVLYALQYIEKKQIKIFLIFNFIAIGFHYTAILALFAYPLYHYINWNKTKFLIILFIGILSNILHLSNFVLNLIPQNSSFIIFQKIISYQKDSGLVYSLGFDLTNIKNILLISIFIIFYNFLSYKIRYFNIIFFIFFIGSIFRIFFSDFGILAARSATLFLTVEPILITYIIYLLKDKYLKVLLIFIIILYSYFQLYFSFNKYKINQFENYIFSSYSINKRL